jgi:hypothetical protein
VTEMTGSSTLSTVSRHYLLFMDMIGVLRARPCVYSRLSTHCEIL